MKRRNWIYWMIWLPVCLANCTAIDLCDENEHPHVVDGFAVEYRWNKDFIAGEDLERVWFVGTRILNTRHVVYRTDKDGRFWVKNEELPDNNPEEGEGSDAPDEPAMPSESISEADGGQELPIVPGGEEQSVENGKFQADISLPGGEYFMMAFTDPRFPMIEKENAGGSESGTKEEEVEGEPEKVLVEDDRVRVSPDLEEFEKDNAMSIKEVKMSHATVKEIESIIDTRWVDMNPGFDYVYNPERRLFVARRDYIELVAGIAYKESFDFKSLIQRVNVEFVLHLGDDIEKEDGTSVKGVKLDDFEFVCVDIAGVVPEVTLSTGLLNTSELKKMLIKLEKPDLKPDKGFVTRIESGTPDVKSAWKFTVPFYVFGLVGGMDEYSVLGPGVVTLSLGINMADGSESSGIVYAKSNLSKQIKEQALTVETGVVNERRRSADDTVTLTIGTPLLITGESLRTAIANDGVLMWDKGGDVEEEI